MSKTQIFISQCHSDKALVQQLQSTLNEIFGLDQYTFFNSQQGGNGTVGMELNKALKDNLDSSFAMIAVITDNYMRSAFCIAELTYFLFNEKQVLPLVFSDSAYHFYTEDLKQAGRPCIDLRSSTDRMAEAREFISFFTKRNISFLHPDSVLDEVLSLFQSLHPVASTRPYLGSADVYDHINRYCYEHGIRQISSDNLDSKELTDHLKPCQEIYLLATTGSSIVNIMEARFLPAALANGANVYMLLPNRGSDFINDVAEIEDPENPDKRKNDMASEFIKVINKLQNALAASRRINPNATGEVYVGCAFTLLRQTVTLGIDKQAKTIWGWLSMTIPPRKTIAGTPSFEFSGVYDHDEPDAWDDQEDKPFAVLMLRHLKAIRDVAIRRGCYIRLSEQRQFTSFFLENDIAEAEWLDKYKKALDCTRAHEEQGDADLIEVAANHPLLKDGTPGPEFRQRLDHAVTLYKNLYRKKRQARIYVPGSVHCDKSKMDPCSLSQAGVEYLLKKGIPQADLLGDTENERYKPGLGVYNSADECFVASEIFKNGNYRRLYCVCSPNQLIRKKLFYIAFGVIPYYETVSSENLAHDDIYELFHAIPDVLYRDHTWQGADSPNGNRTRHNRDPRYALGEQNPPGIRKPLE